jgi:enoyl-CoA hydratase/carnithine racemase
VKPGQVRLSLEGSIAKVVFDRPETRNALSLAGYDELSAICGRIASADALRAVVFRGAGGAFVAGTDIREFRGFKSAEDGIAYEARIDRGLAEIEALPVPTLAVIDGPAMGGGLMIAAVCDLRIATPAAQFGAPIAATLGNCLSAANLDRLERALGLGLTRRMLLLAERIDANAAFDAGFLLKVAQGPELEACVDATLERLASNAPLTIAATRGLLRRPRDPEVDVLRRVYGSRDFKEGVDAFLNKRKPAWVGA